LENADLRRHVTVSLRGARRNRPPRKKRPHGAPALGSVITIRFAIWDAGNTEFDSTVLVDNFQWIASAGVTVGTAPLPQPK
jgi:hypothetical protein